MKSRPHLTGNERIEMELKLRLIDDQWYFHYNEQVKSSNRRYAMPRYSQIEVDILTLGKVYEGSLCPTIYDPYTHQPVDPSYVMMVEPESLMLSISCYKMNIGSYN